MCAWLHTKRTPESGNSRGFFLGYLSDFRCLSNHLLTQSPTKRATTAVTKDIMYCMVYTSFLTEEADKLMIAFLSDVVNNSESAAQV